MNTLDTNLENVTVITAALTGTGTPKSKNPALPTQPKEIAEDAIKCAKAGAAIVHLHMRDDNHMGTMDIERFRETVKRIRGESDVLINLTSSGEKGASDERRMEHIAELRPEIGTFDAGSFNWMPHMIFENSPQFLEKLGKVMTENGVKPEVEVFDIGMLGVANYYVRQGIINAPLHVQFVLGVLGAAEATVGNLVHLQSKLPEDYTWAALGVGTSHLPIMYATIAMGGHLRVGLEDNLYYSKGVLATNEQLVDRAVRALDVYGRQPATPAEARKILGLREA